MRVLWMAAEIGLDYTHVPLEFDDPALKQSDFRRLSPGGTIPALSDGEVMLSESLAINLYLAKTYGAAAAEPLYPANAAEEAEVWRWSLWANAHLEPWVQRDAFLAGLRAAIGDCARPRQTGFADRDRMRRAFLRAFGQPPQAIRRNARAEATV